METFSIKPIVELKYKSNGQIVNINNQKKDSIHYFIKQDISKLHWFDSLLPKKDIDDIGLVIFDPPYGLNIDEKWDKKEWTSKMLENALLPLTKLDNPLYIVFFLIESMLVNVLQLTCLKEFEYHIFYWYYV